MRQEHTFAFDWKRLIPTARHLCPHAAHSEPVMAQTWQSKGGRVSPASVTLMSSHRPLICHTLRWHLLHEWATRIKRHIRLLSKKTKGITASKQSLNQKQMHIWMSLSERVQSCDIPWWTLSVSLHSLINSEDLLSLMLYFWHVLALKQPMKLVFNVSVSLYPLSVSLSLCTSRLNIPASAAAMSSLSPWSNFSLLWLYRSDFFQWGVQ